MLRKEEEEVIFEKFTNAGICMQRDSYSPHVVVVSNGKMDGATPQDPSHAAPQAAVLPLRDQWQAELLLVDIEFH